MLTCPGRPRPPHHPQAEARAEFAERSVQKLQKEVDRLEGRPLSPLSSGRSYSGHTCPRSCYRLSWTRQGVYLRLVPGLGRLIPSRRKS